MVEKILVPVDGSDSAAKAARWASRLAQKLGGSLVLLHVHHSPGSETLAFGGMERSEIEEAEQRIAGPSFAGARAAMEPGVDCTTLVSIGEPADEIVAIAKSEQATLIVMGSRGLSPVRELLLGSVSDKVIRHAHCAVTVVR